MAAEARMLVTREEYLAFERTSDQRHEYIAGEIVAMVGGSPNHSKIAANTIIAIGVRLRGGPCDVYTSDLRIAIPQLDIYTYPDAAVICGEQQLDTGGMGILNPIVIIEVLSPSTQREDRGPKFLRYQRLASLRDYVLISQEAPFVECFSRGDDNRWEWAAAIALDETISLPSIDLELPMAEIYNAIKFATAAND